MFSGGPQVTKMSTLSLTIRRLKWKYVYTLCSRFPKPLSSCGPPSSARLSMQMKMCMEHWWNCNDSRTPTYSEKTVSQCSFVYHKRHTDWCVIEPGIPRSEADEWQLGPLHGPKDHASQRHDVSSRCHLQHELVTTRVTSNMVTEFHILDFKLSPCFECRMLSSG